MRYQFPRPFRAGQNVSTREGRTITLGFFREAELTDVEIAQFADLGIREFGLSDGFTEEEMAKRLSDPQRDGYTVAEMEAKLDADRRRLAQQQLADSVAAAAHAPVTEAAAATQKAKKDQLMAIALAAQLFRGAPGAIVTISGSGFVAAAGASVTLDGQGTSGSDVVTLDSTFAPDGLSVAIAIPDGAVGGTLTITAGDGSIKTALLAVAAQFLTSDEYTTAGEGVDLSGLVAGELDRILQRASAYADAYVAGGNDGATLRLHPIVGETHEWRNPNETTVPNTRVYPFARPIVSIDSFIVKISQSQTATFSATDIVVNSDQGYFEILSYAVASFSLLGAIENIGLVANIVELNYTAGYPIQNYPHALKEAVTMIATELLDYRAIQDRGFGGLSSVKQGQQQYQRRTDPFAIPEPARQLLRPFKRRVFR